MGRIAGGELAQLVRQTSEPILNVGVRIGSEDPD
jgi:hypothetical protein